MSDTEPRDGLPSSIPAPPEERAQAAAVARLDGKLDRALGMLDKIYQLFQEEREARKSMEDRIAALEAIPPPRPTILPPANGTFDG